MTQEELNERAKKAVLTYNINESKKVAQDALDQNADIVDLIQNGFTVGINQVGDLYEQKKLFLPHIMAAANAMNAGVDILTPHLGEQAKTADNLGKFVICTIEGDIHSIGKDIAAIMLKVAGFDVINLGRDIPLKDIAKAVADNNAIAVGTSALMTSTMVNQKAFEEIMKKQGLKGKCLTNVGGAPVTQQWADEIGADVYSENAQDCAVKMVKAVKG
ncbi:methyltransferase cognate corrinoid protein [Methanomethylophilus alvi]|uniref:methyltransferase cognate corrinoid protein n=1 Tax=Methanomethylophilus alvi TaxID=1291540 RepID=UPI0037DDA497